MTTVRKPRRSLLVGICLAVVAVGLGLAVALGSQSGASQSENRLQGPVPTDAQGCSAEFWASNTDAWEEYDPQTYRVADLLGPSVPDADARLIDVLDYAPGEDIDGARRALVRAAAAATLNAAHESIKYPLRRYDSAPAAGFVPVVREHLASANAQSMLEVAAYLDSINSQACPLQ